MLALSPHPSRSPGPGTELSAEQGEPGWGDQGKHAREEQVPTLLWEPACQDRNGMGDSHNHLVLAW